MLKLFYSAGACAMASHFALEEAGAPYELQAIDLRKGEQRTPEYLAINPAGATPALQTAEGVITQNAAILAYLADLYPDAGLAPAAPFARARFNAFTGFLASGLHPALGRLLFSRPPLEGESRTAAADLVLAKLDIVEQHLLEGPFVFGASHTAADGYLSVFTRWARQAGLLDGARYPRLNAHLTREQAREPVRRALAAEGLEPV
ncbi:glutathione S-transferase C-terminal domain-containing protein [Brevundimonas sp.]|uniref:glutathione S-transferase family protein n=1 Tax=Brevundimonas sp. TaxID=1871086 RepID=UPI0022C35EEE|nr:glutathione S-transferase C-terminal domain-containing protein [Brevundimonas sp.]MCZ8194267.1 glutathione S-transferase C-terminal domain-containing protein [Brevundimonas sp.]